MISPQEGYLDGVAGRTFCRSILSGKARALDLIVISGGPGLSWDYLGSLDALAMHGYNVHYYDQVGAGRSECRLPSGKELTLSDLLTQLYEVISHLAQGRPYALLAHSSASAIAIEHALAKPALLYKLILSSGCASGRDMIESIQRCVSTLTPGAQWALNDGDITSADYQAASQMFFEQYVCRMTPTPSALLRSVEFLARNSLAYRALWGLDTFHPTGELARWDATDRLRHISVPTLVCRGAYDEADEACMAVISSNIPGAKRQIFEHSSHAAHLEEAEEFISAIRGFLGA